LCQEKSGNTASEHQGRREWVSTADRSWPGWPDWAILWGACLHTLGRFLIAEVATSTFSYFSHGNTYVLILTRKWVGQHFGAIFQTKLIWSPCSWPPSGPDQLRRCWFNFSSTQSKVRRGISCLYVYIFTQTVTFVLLCVAWCRATLLEVIITVRRLASHNTEQQKITVCVICCLCKYLENSSRVY
jgi:hypothetical protein